MNKITPSYEVVQQLVTFYGTNKFEVLREVVAWLEENGVQDDINIHLTLDEDCNYIAQTNGNFIHKKFEDIL